MYVACACLPALTQDSQGRVLPMPAFAADLSANKLLIQWDVTAEHGTGQVLLLARAAHCLIQLSTVAGDKQQRVHTEEYQVRDLQPVCETKAQGKP